MVGALTGGFFGDFLSQLAKLIDPKSTFALPYLFTPLTDTMAILIGSLVLGLSLIHILTILPTGDVYACRRVQNSKVGNVFNDRLADLWVCQVAVSYTHLSGTVRRQGG